jgi:hypothetical protein
MQHIKRFLSIGLITTFCMAGLTAGAQKNAAKAAAVQQAVDSQRYTFYAEYVQPLTGGQRYLTTEYTLRISKDSIVSDLPYFGRAFSGVGYGGDGGIKFTSTQFEYKVEGAKKGGWDISIRLKDVSNVQQLSLRILPGGSTTVTVNSSNRDPISYTGYVKVK